MARPRINFSCKYPDCSNTHAAKGYCDNHYRTQYVRIVVKPLWQTWQAMKQRCYNPNDPRYADWGGRGIEVCDEWLHDYAAFEAYMGVRPKGMTLDRIDNDKNYEPGNVRWATAHEQAMNRRPKKVGV